MRAEKFLTLSKSLLCLSLAASCLIVMPCVISYQLTALRNSATIEIEQTRKEMLSQIIQTRKEIIDLVDRRFDSLQGKTDSWIKTADNRIASIQTDTFNSMGIITRDVHDAVGGVLDTASAMNANLNNQLTTANKSISRLSEAYSVIPATVGSRLDRQTDCAKNALCWQNLTTDTLTNFRYTGRDISSSSKAFEIGFPKLLKNVDDTTSNFAAITANFKKLTTPHWYDRVLGIAVNGSLVYSRFTPAAIPVTVIQAVSATK